MHKYELSRAADRDLDGIYVYTFHQFGELQVDAYFESLEDCLTGLAENPLMGMDAGHIRAGYQRFIHRRHTIYYRRTKSGARIVRILGPGMSEGAIRK